uniref:Uncharacterized protein n=1 Tax=Sarcophilus harrisii TaxID=9305 RepID=A0A7N4UWX7_SARHA
MKVDVFHRHLLVALSSGGLQCIPSRHLPLSIINALTYRAAIHTELQILALFISHSQVFGHADSQSQVAPQLPHVHRGSDVPGVHLHMMAAHLLHNVQAFDLTIPTTGGAINESCWQVICHGLVYFLIGTLMVRFENDSYLQKIRKELFLLFFKSKKNWTTTFCSLPKDSPSF